MFVKDAFSVGGNKMSDVYIHRVKEVIVGNIEDKYLPDGKVYQTQRIIIKSDTGNHEIIVFFEDK